MTSIRKWVERLLVPDSSHSDAFWLEVQCSRCGEGIRARVNLRNDLSRLDEGTQDTPAYYCRKILVGQTNCFQRIEVEIFFDARRNLIEKKVSGGQFTEV